MTSVATIGYEGTTVRQFLDAVSKERVELLVDVRAIASSRRPGFAKTRHRLLVADALQRWVPNLEVRHLTAEQED